MTVPSSDVTFLQSGTSAVSRTAEARFRDTVHAADFGYGAAGNTPAQDAAALQAAVDRGSPMLVLLPGGLTVEIDATIEVPIRTIIQGQGTGSSDIISTADPAFRLLAGTGYGEVEGIALRDLTLTCSGSGIQLNDPDGSFEENGTGQRYIMRARLERVRLIGPGSGVTGSCGVNWNKCFSAVIDQCEIAAFETGVKHKGCDICSITNNTRVWQCGTLVHTEHVTPEYGGQLGSLLLIDGADLLQPVNCFIYSSNNQLAVVNSYMERQEGTLGSFALDIRHRRTTIFQGNRIDIPTAYAANFLRVRGDGTLFAFENNSSTADWGTVEWKGDDGTTPGALYHLNNTSRQKIMEAGNAKSRLLPFSTAEPEQPKSYPILWNFSPATTGLTTSDYGTSVRVVNGAFVLPEISSFGSLIKFKDAGNPITGTVDILVNAKAVNNGQELKVGRINESTPIATQAVALSQDYVWYKPFSGVAVTDLTVALFNDEPTPGDDISVRQIMVRVTAGL
jgi:hypothetical protein